MPRTLWNHDLGPNFLEQNTYGSHPFLLVLEQGGCARMGPGARVRCGYRRHEGTCGDAEGSESTLLPIAACPRLRTCRRLRLGPVPPQLQRHGRRAHGRPAEVRRAAVPRSQVRTLYCAGPAINTAQLPLLRSFRVTGGILDLFVLAGPTPLDGAQRRLALQNQPAPRRAWELGSTCRMLHPEPPRPLRPRRFGLSSAGPAHRSGGPPRYAAPLGVRLAPVQVSRCVACAGRQ